MQMDIKRQPTMRELLLESNAVSIPGEKSTVHNSVPSDVPAGILKVNQYFYSCSEVVPEGGEIKVELHPAFGEFK